MCAKSGDGTISKQGINSVRTAISILDVFVEANEALSLKDVCERSGIAPGKAHRYLQTMLESGLAIQETKAGKYSLGKRALRLGIAAMSQYDPVQHALSGLEDLAHDLRGDSMLATWTVSGPIILRVLIHDRQSTAHLHMGDVMPVLTSAMGQVFLGYLPQSDTAGLVATEKARRSIDVDPDEVRQRVRANGYVISMGRYLSNFCSVSAPIFDVHNDIVAAVTVTSQEKDFIDNIGERAQQIVAYCRRFN